MYHRLSINCLELAGGRSPGWPVTLASSQGYSCTGCASHFGEQPVLGALHGSANCPDSLRRNAAPTTSKGISVPVCFRSFPQERVEDVSISRPPTLSLHSCSRGFCKAMGPLSAWRSACEK